jgi:hypothetical protein
MVSSELIASRQPLATNNQLATITNQGNHEDLTL